MRKYVIHSQAEAEFMEAVDFYSERRRGQGKKFQAAVEKSIERICRTPTLFTPYHTVYRKLVMKKYPLQDFLHRT